MIRIQQLKLPPGHSQEALLHEAARKLHIKPAQILALTIHRRSIDARKKPQIRYFYTVDVSVRQSLEAQLLKRCRDQQITAAGDPVYRFPEPGTVPLSHRPVIIGTGPAGLFCGYLLARHGYRPILLERGADVEQRQAQVSAFWNGAPLQPESNVQFGEGGAGTFSDGKLNTLVKDKEGRNREVLQIFVSHGANEEILYESKPHIGTDVLTGVVKSMREQILAWGGEVRFQTKAADLLLSSDRRVEGVLLADGTVLPCSQVVLAIGHSARDTFEMLLSRQIPMEAKSFAVGLRVQHPQALINTSQYGEGYPSCLPPASYKLTAQAGNGRGVYSFCMCPGGYVVNASSEPGRLAVNGMSYQDRGSEVANSAIIVSVTPQDFGGDGPLSGVAFQRRLEEKAYALGAGSIPVQPYGAFAPGQSRPDSLFPPFDPCICGSYRFADVASILPEPVKDAFIEGMASFDRVIPGFADPHTLVAGIESRTSSPVRIHRDETLQSEVRGLYPCGEGAGYAGGITSAAMDGMRVAEAIAASFAPFKIEKNPARPARRGEQI